MVTAGFATVDWLTGTTKSDDVGWSWYRTINREKELLKSDEGAAYGYSRYGYQGFQIGGLVWAHNPKWGYLVQATGEKAWRLYAEIHKPLSRFTRLDLQVTVECDPPEPDYIRQTYLAHKNDEMPSFTYYEKHGSDTCYVGSRVSERFGRIYDKGLESGMSDEKGRYIRYEVEVKGEVARKFEDSYGLAKIGNLESRQARDRISSFVYDYFRSRGIEMLYNALPAIPVEVGRRVSTAETKLAWIHSSVRQTVEFLIDAGHSDRLVEALSLTEGQAIELTRQFSRVYQLKLFPDDDVKID